MKTPKRGSIWNSYDNSAYGKDFNRFIRFTGDATSYLFSIWFTMLCLTAQLIPWFYRFTTLETIGFFASELFLFALYIGFISRPSPTLAELNAADEAKRERFFASEEGKDWAELDATLNRLSKKYDQDY